MTNTLNGATTAAFVVALSQALTEPVQVKWATKDGTGKAGTDYDAISGTLVFAPGETSKQIQVTVYGRDPGQGAGDKTFYIVVEPPINAILDDTLVECTIVVMDEEGTPVTSVIVAQGRRGPKGEPGLSAYEQAVLMGYQGSIQDWMDDVADASQAADRANTAATRSETAATRAESAATSASFLGNIFPNPAAGVDPVTGVANGAYYNVRSPSSDSYLDEYQNVNGTPVASGKSFPSAEIINNIRKIGGTMKFEQDFSDAINGFDINNRVMLDTGGIVKSTVPNNIINPNISMNGWKPDIDVLHPSFFGVSENIADATEKLRLMHNIANQYNLDVSYAGLVSVNVQADARIFINTNTDFAGCRLDALNGIVSNPAWNGQTKRMFIVSDPNRKVTTLTLNVSELTAGQTQITVPDSAMEGLLVINSNKRIGNRTSNPNENLYFQQSFTLSSGGVLNLPLVKDLTQNTVTATLYSENSKRWVTIKGLYADISKFNNQSLLRVERNYVKVTDWVFERSIRNEPASANALIWFWQCSNIIFEDSRTVAPADKGLASYGLNMSYCADVILRTVTGVDLDSWGYTVCNYVTGLYAENYHFGRLDAHQGMMYWKVRGGVLHGHNFQYGWGGGYLDIDGATVIADRILYARNDYDGDFDGSISIKNIKWIIPTKSGMTTESVDNGSGAETRYIAKVFDATQSGTTSVDASGNIIKCKLATDITIENIEVIAPSFLNGQLTIALIWFELINASAIVHMPKNVSIKNVYSNDTKLYLTLAKSRYSASYPYYSAKNNSYEDTVFRISDLDCLPCNGRRHGLIVRRGTDEQVGSFTQFNNLGKTIKFNVNNSKGVIVDYSAPSGEYNIFNCEIGALNFGAAANSGAKCNAYNSKMLNTVRSDAGNGRLGQIGTGAAECNLYNVAFKSAVNIVNITSIIGTTVDSTVSIYWSQIPTLTYAQMFNGWYNTSKYS